MYALYRKAAPALVLALAASAPQAEEGSSDAPDEATLEAAQALVDQRYQGQMHERLRQGMKRTLMQSMPRLRQQPEAVDQFVNNNTDQGELAEHLKGEYAKRFTRAELEQLTQFYSTDVGQKTLETIPDIERSAMRWSMKKLQQNSESLRRMIQEANQGQGGGQSQGSGQSSGGSSQSQPSE